MKPSANTLFIVLTALIASGGAYWYYQMANEAGPTLSQDTGQNAAQVEFQTLVTELEPISFDTTVFSDPRFIALTDLTTSIAPEQSGRTDPFAPVAGVAASAQQ
jgi:hypothetical protein